MRRLLVSVSAPLALAGSARAAWTPAVDVPGTAGRYPLLARLEPSGVRLVGVFGPLVLFPRSPQAPVAIARAPAGGPFGAAAPLPDGLAAPLTVSSGGTVLAVGGPRGPLDYFGSEGPSATLRVGIGRLGGRLHRIATGGIAATSALAAAVNDRGDGAVVFARCRETRCATRAVLATFRRRGGRFSQPIVLADRTRFAAAAVALNAHGDALLAWEERRTAMSADAVRARVRRAGGGLTTARVVGSTMPRPTIVATLSDERRGVVVWFSEYVTEGSVGGPIAVTAARLHPTGAVARRTAVDSGKPGAADLSAVSGPRLRAVLDGDGITTLAWTGYADGHYAVRARRLPGATETLSPPGTDAQLADLAGDVAGDAIVAWAPALNRLTTPAPAGTWAAIRAAPAKTFGESELALEGTGAGPTVAAASTTGGHALLAAAPTASGGSLAAPPVRVTQWTP